MAAAAVVVVLVLVVVGDGFVFAAASVVPAVVVELVVVVIRGPLARPPTLALWSAAAAAAQERAGLGAGAGVGVMAAVELVGGALVKALLVFPSELAGRPLVLGACSRALACESPANLELTNGSPSSAGCRLVELAVAGAPVVAAGATCWLSVAEWAPPFSLDCATPFCDSAGAL